MLIAYHCLLKTSLSIQLKAWKTGSLRYIFGKKGASRLTQPALK